MQKTKQLEIPLTSSAICISQQSLDDCTTEHRPNMYFQTSSLTEWDHEAEFRYFIIHTPNFHQNVRCKFIFTLDLALLGYFNICFMHECAADGALGGPAPTIGWVGCNAAGLAINSKFWKCEMGHLGAKLHSVLIPNKVQFWPKLLAIFRVLAASTGYTIVPVLQPNCIEWTII